jgi:hypothetical protein
MFISRVLRTGHVPLDDEPAPSPPMEIARHLSSFASESVACIKRLVRNATETPLAGTGTRTKSLLELVHHRTCTRAHAFYEEHNITSLSRSMVAKQGL